MADAKLRQITRKDREWVLDQHRHIYVDGHGFDESFERLVAEIVDRFLQRHDPGFERGWVAEWDGQRLGSVFCMKLDETTAQLRLFFLIEEARGQGLGRKMVDTLVQFAKAANYQKIMLWTHQSHTAACALYRATGWHLIESKPTVSFGREEVIETYLLTL